MNFNRAKLLPAIGFLTSVLWAQTGGKPVGTVGTTPGTGTISTGSPNISNPGSASSTNQGNLGDTRPIFISGKVMMADGLPVPPNVGIQRICSGNPKTMAYADISGGFSSRWGQPDTVVADASEGGMGSSRSIPGLSSASGSLGGAASTSNSSNPRSTMGCELRANLAGYRSDTINLSGRMSLDDPDVGVIVLHRMSGNDGKSPAAVSASSLRAPKRARKSYEQGQLQLMKNNPDRAAREFETAVAEYPGYADAWLSLGKLRHEQNSPEQARMALLKAAAADPKLVATFIELGLIASEERNWEDTLKYLDHATRLDANYPIAWFTMAIAGYNLKKFDEAEKNVRQAVRLDPKHGLPREQYLLGLILEQKQQFSAAKIELLSYLRYDPIAPDEPQVRAEIRRIDQMLGEANQAAK